MANPAPIRLSPEALRRQKLRNWAIFGSLILDFAFVILVFVISIVKMKGGN